MKRVYLNPIFARLLLTAVKGGSGDRKSMKTVQKWTKNLTAIVESGSKELNAVLGAGVQSPEFAMGLKGLVDKPGTAVLMDNAEHEFLVRVFDARKDWINSFAPALIELGDALDNAEEVELREQDVQKVDDARKRSASKG